MTLVKKFTGKKHLGLGLFCAKKPPKAENNDNELTHHQRAHKKNILLAMCDLQKKEDPSCRHNLIISQDDKAYICPGTSTGMASVRNQKVFQSVDENVSRKLPKYDFPRSMLNITPGTHRFMEKEVCTVENKEEIKIVNDQTIVFVWPKYFFGSSALVCENEME